jgi:nicotinamidase-related amidase
MDKLLIIIDMQNDFIDGTLANPAAKAIVPATVEYIKNWSGEIVFTMDTHYPNYFETQEGKNLPVEHCRYNTEGWEINKELVNAAIENENCEWTAVTKDSFGDISELINTINPNVTEIYLCGTCTDICVISVALNLKAHFPEIKMYCIADLCAGLTPEKHAAAIEVMKSCQVNVI